MADPVEFSELIGIFMTRGGISPGTLSKLTAQSFGSEARVPKATIVNWQKGLVRKPRDWNSILRVAKALRLPEVETNLLLQSVGYPTIFEISKLTTDIELKSLLGGWNEAVLGEAMDLHPLYLHQLSPPPGDFTGRSSEFNDILSVLIYQKVNVIGLFGMGGVGKTTLALKLAEQLTPQYPDAQLLINLRGASQQSHLTPRDVMVRVIRAFLPEIRLPENETELQALYRSVLHGKSSLLILDNAADDRQVKPLIPPSGCLLIITSRKLFTLPGLHLLKLDYFPASDAQTFLTKICTRIKSQAKEIASLCGNLPIALRAMGSLFATTPDLDPGEYIVEMRDMQRRLEHIGTVGVELGVEASINLSYRQLKSSTAAVFRMLAVFPGSFSAEAEEVICQDVQHKHLSQLVQRSLVEWNSIHARYQLHDLVRIFAANLLSDNDKRTTQSQLSAYFGEVIVKAVTLYNQGGHELKLGLGLFDVEWENIEAGFTWAAANHDSDDFAAKLCNDYIISGWAIIRHRLHPEDKMRWVENALSAAQRMGDQNSIGNHHGLLGIINYEQGQTQAAIRHCEQALTTFRQIKKSSGESSALGNLGLVYASQGKFRQALGLYEEQLNLADQIDDDHNRGSALSNIANVYKNLGNHFKAIEYQEKALFLAREKGDRYGEAASLNDMGNAYYELRDYHQAVEFYQQGLKIAREVGDRHIESSAIGNLGLVFFEQGDYLQSAKYYKKALEIDRSIGNLFGEEITLANLGELYEKMGEFQCCIECCDQALEIAKHIEDRRGEGDAQKNMAPAFYQLGHQHKAITCIETALEIYEQLGIEDATTAEAREQLSKWKDAMSSYEN